MWPLDRQRLDNSVLGVGRYQATIQCSASKCGMADGLQEKILIIFNTNEEETKQSVP